MQPGPTERLRIDDVSVDQPCPMRWAQLEGDDRRRFCSECSLHVVNLSALTRDEGQEVLDRGAEAGRLCVTFRRRADGSIVTAEPRIRRRFPALLASAASFLFGFLPLLAGCRPRGVETVTTDPPVEGGEHCTELLGEVALPEGEVPELEIVGDVAYPGEVMGGIAPPSVTPGTTPADPGPGAGSE